MRTFKTYHGCKVFSTGECIGKKGSVKKPNKAGYLFFLTKEREVKGISVYNLVKELFDIDNEELKVKHVKHVNARKQHSKATTVQAEPYTSYIFDDEKKDKPEPKRTLQLGTVRRALEINKKQLEKQGK